MLGLPWQWFRFYYPAHMSHVGLMGAEMRVRPEALLCITDSGAEKELAFVLNACN